MRYLYTLLTVILLAAPTAAPAESNWWERGREAVESWSGTDGAAALTPAEMADGLREALRVGTANVVEQLGRRNGYYRDPQAHIPLPGSLARVRDTLERVGLSDQLDDLERRMNRAAEAAAPEARDLFLRAISRMTLDDARRIYNGPEDAATRYFRRHMSEPLAAEFRPVVSRHLARVDAVAAYDRVMAEYEQLPLVPDVKGNLTTHVVDHAIGAIFDYLAREEAAIRQQPAKRTTALLKKVFGR